MSKIFLIDNKKTIAIALILLLTASSAISILPVGNAVDLPDAQTYPGITVAPNPIGVGQWIQVIMFLSFLPASEGFEFPQVAGQPYEIPHGGWKGLVLTITKPDGTTETMGPYETDPSGIYQVTYTPITTGNYSFQFSYPGEEIIQKAWGGQGASQPPFVYNAHFLPSISKKVSVTVQEEPLPWWNSAPFPTSEWSRPIYGENREWFSIGGPWLQSSYNASGPFNPYTTAPNTAHILWTKSNTPLGGLIGGDYGSLEFQRSTGFSVVAIMGGRVYYNGPVTSSGTAQLYCMDLRTQKQIWSSPVAISPSTASILNWRSLQSKVEIPYLWTLGGTYYMYDAQTGRLLLNFTGASSGTAVLEPPYPASVPGTTQGGASGGGALLVYLTGYYYNTSNPASSVDWVACWNSTQAMQSISKDSHVVSYTTGSAIPWKNGLMWNVSYPYEYAGPTRGIGGALNAAWGIKGVDDIVLVGKNQIMNNATGVASMPVAGYDVATGNRLWIKNITIPTYSTGYYSFGPMAQGVWTNVIQDTQVLYGYSTTTGNELWQCKPFENDFSMQSGGGGTPAYGNFYCNAYDGYMHCINIKDGTQLWDTVSELGGLEMPEEAYPLSAPTIADGKIFSSTSKAYETEPLYRGHCLYAFNASTGEKVWNISGQYSNVKVSDGYILATNNYDAAVYCFGKGPTATTVTAPMTAITAGSPVVIQGTVTDQSPGAKDSPAISDNDMTPWMQYKYQDQPMPTNAKGVDVSIDAVDPNNNFVHLGDTTSDSTGLFRYTWTPPAIPGDYAIIATFTGSNSYYSSSGETGAVVVDAPTQTEAPQAIQSAVDYSFYFIGTAIAIILAIAIATLIIMRKRP